MGRPLALCVLVLAIWAGVEVFTKGVDQAFGGLFAASTREVREVQTTSRRAAGAFQRAYDQSEGRVDRVLERQPE